MSLSWLNQFQQMRKLGIHAFLFVGAAGDGFPCALHPDHDGPVDALENWEQTMLRALKPKNEKVVLTWMFDVVRGFQFNSPNGEKSFRDLLSPPKPESSKRSNDPIAQARQEMEQREPLPLEPSDALTAMLVVMERAANASTTPMLCRAILPDLETLCPASAVGPDKSVMRGALALRKLIASDAVKRAGHLVIASVPAVSALHERLHRPDSPFHVIRVQKPSEQERLAYLEVLTTDGGLMQCRTEHILCEDEITIAVGKEIQRLQTKKSDLEAALERIDARRESALKEDDVIREMERRLRVAQEVKAQAEQTYYRRSGDRQQNLQRRIKQLTAELAKPAQAACDLTEEIWDQMKVGDIVRIFHVDGGDMTVKRVIKHTEGAIAEFCGRPAQSVHLSSFENPDEVNKDPNTHRAIQYLFKGGRLYVRAYDGRHKRIEEFGRARHIPGSRLRAEGELKECQEALQNIMDTDPELRSKTQACEFANQELTKARRRTQERWQEQHDRVANELQAVTQKLEDRGSITNDEVDALRKRMRELDVEIAALAKRKPLPKPAMALPELARLSQGLGYRNLTDLVIRADRGNLELSYAEVVAARQEMLQKAYGEFVEVVEPSYGFEGIAGLDVIKDFLGDVKSAIQSGNLRCVPMGCLLLGPPGTGKTAIAEGFARECGFLFVKVKNLRTMWVGESERKQEELLAALKDLAPVVVLRDEVDEEDSGRDSFQGDSGVSGRLRRMWMTMLSDPAIRGRIFVISCTNRPDRLDPALKRSGRTDERIPVLMPDEQTRRALFPVMIRRGGFPSNVENFDQAVMETDGLSGADIEVIVRHAYEFSVAAGKQAIEPEQLQLAIEDFVPSASQEQIARMTLSAIAETSSRRFMPPNATEIVKQCYNTLGNRVGEQPQIAVVAVPVAVEPPPGRRNPGSDPSKQN